MPSYAPRPVQVYHFWENLIWRGGPFTYSNVEGFFRLWRRKISLFRKTVYVQERKFRSKCGIE
jgi:hypothetical protein